VNVSQSGNLCEKKIQHKEENRNQEKRRNPQIIPDILSIPLNLTRYFVREFSAFTLLPNYAFILDTIKVASQTKKQLVFLMK